MKFIKIINYLVLDLNLSEMNVKNDYDYKKLNQKFNLNLKVSGCSSHPHHLYLEVLSELGIVGFTMFLAFYISRFFIPFLRILVSSSEIKKL